MFVTHRNWPGQKPPWTGSHESPSLAPSRPTPSSSRAPSGVAAASFEDAIVLSPEQLPDIEASTTMLSATSDREIVGVTFTLAP
jgi:hypothetical protein